MWSPGLVSARGTAVSVSVPEPRAHFGSSLLVLQYEFSELMWSLLICRVIPKCLSPLSHRASFGLPGWHRHCYSFPLGKCAVREEKAEKEELLTAGVLKDVLAQVHSFSLLHPSLVETFVTFPRLRRDQRTLCASLCGHGRER